MKLSTKIYGLDKILRGGLDLDKDPLAIVIRGAANTHRTLFALQLLYGLGLSLKESDNSDNLQAYYASMYDNQAFLEEMMVNTLISAFFRLMIRKKIENPDAEISELSSFTNFFFDTSDILFQSHQQSQDVGALIRDIKEKPEDLIADGVLYYHSRTGALHYRTHDYVADDTNMVYHRAKASINEFVDLKDSHANGAIKIMEDYLQLQLFRMNIVTKNNKMMIPNDCKLLGMELDNAYTYKVKEVRELLTSMKHKSRISVLVANESVEVDMNDVDILIDLNNKEEQGYLFHYMTLFKNSAKYSMSGTYQYKARDYGIEVFPSLHFYSIKKKSFHRSFIYTHAGIIGDTYPQFLERKLSEVQNTSDISYEEYLREKNNTLKKDLGAMLPRKSMEYVSYDLLNHIFMHNQNNAGTVTAIVGGGNTFKRFLTIGSAFSSAVKGEDTLLILLNKEKPLIQKRMSCPARLLHCTHKEKCEKCYRFFHLMNIYPEKITAEEFVYILNQHLILGYGSGRYIKRIIIDGLQAVDYSFPFLKGNALFLSSVINLCRDKNISLYVISDKEAGLCGELVALADNVVKTEKNRDGRPRIFIDRCSGHNNPPSKMYCGEVRHIHTMFECKEQYHKDNGCGKKSYELSFNPLQFKEKTVLGK